MKMKAILIGGAQSGTGKTLLTLGLLRALARRGLRVQPFKCGPDYIDTGWHQAVSGIPSHNLDAYMLESSTLNGLFNRHMSDADIGIIEGVMGLYDGLGSDGDRCSSASLAKQLRVPVILVIDGKAVSTSAAAVVLGFKQFDPAVNIAGVIINRVSSENHFNLIKTAILRYCNVPVLGYLPPLPDWNLPSRHLGLIPARESERGQTQWEQLADGVEQHIDLDRLLALAECRPDVGRLPALPGHERYSGLTLALADDEAFNFYYPDNLRMLQDIGVRIIRFSPLHDRVLPPCQMIYLGGGFPEMFPTQLADNRPMRQALLRAGQNGTAIYAECGGLMYLGAALIVQDGTSYPMVGLLQGFSRMTQGLKRFGYCEGRSLSDNLLAGRGETLRGHEFHHSEYITDETPLFRMSKTAANGEVHQWAGGYGGGNIFASYLHVHFYQRPAMVKRWLDLGCAQL
ncbi:hydrogenobyrinic acid a,c-diamide synthase (glutamine-hydrolysing) /cobyrinate a,c-diamide synthase [Sodalis ligni]|uniref:Cobyrinate a,c-diamide synthase n=2 Tax=Sodalis ligni TaxID=2697027 RepID=A0A4R1N5T5_9GAMM|nr:hydrogenobyrinic acid a,c-diamide synthase (glutamine-hydrolysing) /cobyrinate a,c-diamide synthase [Sodalis ligni]